MRSRVSPGRNGEAMFVPKLLQCGNVDG
jgi:hypothetical protein